MTQTQRAAIVGTVLAILLTAFTGSALAGNGNGNGGGNGNGNGNGNSPVAPAPEPASPAPGNSANAPGHNKAVTATTSSTSSTSGTAAPQTSGTTSAAHGKGHSSAKSPSGKASGATTSSGQGSASQNSPGVAGVKPTNATFHNTHTTVGASPNVSKRYGNGHTAAGIASSRGAPASTPLYGPGNSQPHKVETCPGSGHWVDVHAVKRYSSASCASSSQPSQSTTVEHVCGATTVTTTLTTTQHGHAYGRLKHGKALHTRTASESVTTATGEDCSSVFESVLPIGGSSSNASSSSNTSKTSNTSSTSQASQVAGSQASVVSSQSGTKASGSSSSAGGTLGASASAKGSAKPAGGVAGAVASVGNVAGQTLPFTGFPIWLVVVIALALIVTGLALRRRARATV